MTDVFDPAKRSAVMRAVRGADTGPEIIVRRLAHGLGYRFRLQRKDLPGKPDLVFPRLKLALFVHGCFWHGHDCARGARVPKTNRDYWLAKIGRNRTRDACSIETLAQMGWQSAAVWECETRDQERLKTRLKRELARRASRLSRP
jgi:DNA mismatch endonuclease (patch repair protein)